MTERRRRPIRVLVIDDDPAFRRSLCAGFTAQDDIEIVGEAADGIAAVELAATVAADVIVMDVHMPGLSGLEATREMRSRDIETPVVVLTADAGQAKHAAHLRHVAFLVKGETGLAEAVSAVRTVS